MSTSRRRAAKAALEAIATKVMLLASRPFVREKQSREVLHHWRGSFTWPHIRRAIAASRRAWRRSIEWCSMPSREVFSLCARSPVFDAISIPPAFYQRGLRYLPAAERRSDGAIALHQWTKVEELAEYVALQSIVGRWRLRVTVSRAALSAGPRRWSLVATSVSRRFDRSLSESPNAADAPLIDRVSSSLHWVRSLFGRLIAPTIPAGRGQGAALERAMHQAFSSLWAVELEIIEADGLVDAHLTPWGLRAEGPHSPPIPIAGAGDEEITQRALAALRESIVAEKNWGTSEWGPRIRR